MAAVPLWPSLVAVIVAVPAAIPVTSPLLPTVATGRGAATVAAAAPLCPSLKAVIVAAPVAIPVTRPVLLTVATAGALLAHVTVRPVSGLPLASFGVAVSCAVAPTSTLGAAGL